MRISYAICVCNEYRELRMLLNFLRDVRNVDESEIVCLVDTSKPNKLVDSVLMCFPEVKIIKRSFNNDFADHKNFLNDACQGDIIFNIDADEIPQEKLVHFLQGVHDDFDILYVPRINICPGYTEKFLKTHNFNVTNEGWINWPDYQGRIYKKGITWEGNVHERPYGKDAIVKFLPDNPHLALWHIKDVDRQNRQNELYKSIQALDQV